MTILYQHPVYPWLYVSRCGRVISTRSGKEIDPKANSRGYKVHLIKIRGRIVAKALHRIVFEAIHGSVPKGMEVDHIDRNRINNHINNLRACSPSENLRNRVAYGEVGIKGVSIERKTGRYVAKNRGVHIGTYRTKEEAGRAFAAATQTDQYQPRRSAS